MNFPSDIKYDKSHEWARIEGSTATIGITDFAQSELGDVVFVDITLSVGDEVTSGDVFGSIEAVKTVSDLFAPIGGTVLEINTAIDAAPETINSDPYSAGWIIKLDVGDNPDLSTLMDASAYASLVGH